MNSTIGKIVKSNSHTDYVCQIYAPGEIKPLPEPADYAFGTFVAIRLAEDAGSSVPALVGIVYNTLLVNPDYGNLGPRLSERPDLEVFAPDYLSETATLVGILAVGWLDGQGVAHQGVPDTGGIGQCVGAPARHRDRTQISCRSGWAAVDALHAHAHAVRRPVAAVADAQHRRSTGAALPGSRSAVRRRAQQPGLEGRCSPCRLRG